MPKLPESFIQQVQQSTDIVDLVSQYVSLKKSGKEFVGLCPFHDDHRPSMYVVPGKQMFHCFVCQAGGGVFQWVMLYDKLPFPEAVRMLAERAGIPVPRCEPLPPGQEDLSSGELVKTTTFAARFYRDRLQGPGGREALQYARGRGITDESIRRFGLGYAPASWDALLTAARREGHSEKKLVAAGLAIRRDDGGCYDRFRNRLMFPILDPAGRVIAFGGRALDEAERAKYLNSPETALFDKSSQLYALNWAREGISRTGQAVVVEGYLDALIPLQEGLDNVVATLGTALTDRHVNLLARYASQIVLVFDSDEAGVRAAERALEIFLAQRVHPRVVTIPAGKDPCDYCLAEGAEALRALIDTAPDALQHVWARRQDAFARADNLADRQELIDNFLSLVVSSAAYGAIDTVRQGQLAQHIGHMLNIPAADLQQRMRRLGRRVRRPAGATGQRPPPGPRAGTVTERHLLGALLNEPALFDTVVERVDPADFATPQLRQVAEEVWRLGHDGRLTLDDLLSCESLAEVGSVLTDLVSQGRQLGDHEVTARGAADYLVRLREQREIDTLKQAGLDEGTRRALQEHLGQADPRRAPKIR